MPDLVIGHTEPGRERGHPGLELPGIRGGNPPCLDNIVDLLSSAGYQLQRDAGLPASAQPVEDVNAGSIKIPLPRSGELIEQGRPPAQRTIRIAAAQRSSE